MAFASGRLTNFVEEVIDYISDEYKEKTLWEVWLHKEWEMSWRDFREAQNVKNSNNTTRNDAAPTQEEQIDIMKQTMRIMESFCPLSEGEADGNIQTSGENSN